MTGGSNKRVSLAALIAIKPGAWPRLMYRVHKHRLRGKDQRKGFTEADYARLSDAAHQQLAGLLVIVWDNLNSHVSAAMAELVAARAWLTVFQLPPYAHELNPVELVWSHLKRIPGQLRQTQPRPAHRPGQDPAAGGCNTGPVSPTASSPRPGWTSHPPGQRRPATARLYGER